MKSKVFTLAHQIKHLFNSFSDALKAAWRIVKAEFGKVVNVCYSKLDESTRYAEMVGINTISPIKDYVRYYEIIEGEQQTRCFKISRLLFN